VVKKIVLSTELSSCLGYYDFIILNLPSSIKYSIVNLFSVPNASVIGECHCGHEPCTTLVPPPPPSPATEYSNYLMVICSLPVEVTERIIDYLYNDTAALRSSALVCQSWLEHCRYHLFHSIAVDLSPDSCKLLFDTLQSAHSPDRYIRQVTWSSFSTAANRPEAFTPDSTLVQLVQRLHQETVNYLRRST
jgi:hypothetical protein